MHFFSIPVIKVNFISAFLLKFEKIMKENVFC